MDRISTHISAYEGTHSDTATRRKIKNEPNDKQLQAMRHLANEVFEPLRIHFNTPIRVNSFFRSVSLNKAIGGSRTSQHCLGEAIDIKVVSKEVSNADLFNYIKENLDFDQLIWEFGTDKNPDWVHISFKLSGKNRKRVLKAVRNGNPTYRIMK